jgi:hypothetical protein
VNVGRDAPGAPCFQPDAGNDSRRAEGITPYNINTVGIVYTYDLIIVLAIKNKRDKNSLLFFYYIINIYSLK